MSQERLIMMMNNKIEQVGRQYAYAIQPVKLFETQSKNQAQKSSFDFINQMNLQTDYNPFHPNVKTKSVASRLDLMG